MTDYLEGRFSRDARDLEAHLGVARLPVVPRPDAHHDATVGRIEEADVPPELRDSVLAAFRDRRV